jgi:hypothetical protein
MPKNAETVPQVPPASPRHSWGTIGGLLLAGLLLTLFFTWLIWPAPESSERASPTAGAGDGTAGASQASELRALRAELELEIASRERLEREVSRLQARIDTLDSQTAELEQAAIPRDEGEQVGETRAQDASQRRAFDSSALVASGIDPEEAESLRALWEEVQLERMYLTDEAEREGWAGTARHRQELRALETGLREELSPEVYDRYLYATGKKNRSQVVDVISHSPGERAGFRVGDTILSYDGQRVFSVEEVRKLSSSGLRGEMVSIEVARGDSTTVLQVPRGPIGLMLMPHAEPPR